MSHVSANVINDAYRAYEDDTSGAVTAQTAIATVDTNWTQAVDTKFHVAMLATETAGGSANNYAYRLEYNLNSGGWTDVTSTTPIQSVSATNCTTSDAASYGTTALTTGATIQATEYDTGGADSAAVSLSGASFEYTTCLQIDSAQVANNDSIQLRLTNGGTALDADTTIPTITVSESNDLAVTATLGSLSLSEQTPTTVGTESNSAATLGSLSLTGFNAVTGTESNSTATLGSLSLSGFNPTVTTEAPLNVTATLGSLNLTGLNPSVDAQLNLTATLSSQTLTGQNATVGTESNTTATLGGLSLTGFNPVVSAGADLSVTATLGSLALTGFTTTTETARNTTVSLGGLSLTGFNPTVNTSSGLSITATVESLTLSALNASVTAGATTAEGVVYTHVNEEWIGSTTTILIPMI